MTDKQLYPLSSPLSGKAEKSWRAKIYCVATKCDSLLLGTRINGLPMDADPPCPGIAVESAVQCLTGIRHPKVHVRHQIQGYLGETSQRGV